MELLSPAGDINSFYTAIYNGADAVYLGLKSFNARIKADNFTVDNIEKIVEFAHIYNVKVYVTINILIKDVEINEFLDTVRACVNANVDAYIIQDFGMANLLLEKFDNIVLHASTQMGIHNLSGAKALEEIGFKRVVLARETKLEDIKLIKQNTNLEIEYFAQGALCVAFSGNCYLSSLKNGNSGNRGKCLQLCRLPYKVFEGEKLLTSGYYLSPKDLCLLDRLVELKDAGVDCLKLEGRLKRPGYVAQVTRSYRKALSFLENDEQFKSEREKQKMSELFSRGEFNDSAYLFDNFNIINTKISNHEGKLIGKVIKSVRFKDIFKTTLELTEPIGQNDAIRLVAGNDVASIGIGNVNILKDNKYEIFSTRKAIIGARVYLLKSEAKEKLLTDFVRYLPVNFKFVGKVGNKAELIASYSNITVSIFSENVLEKAKTTSATYESIYKQVSKLNDTKFRLEILECDIDDCFIAVSELNAMRRNVITELESEIIKLYNMTLQSVTEKTVKLDLNLSIKKENFYLISELKDLENMEVEKYNIILSPSIFTKNEINTKVLELVKKGISKERIYLNLPIVSTESEMDELTDIVYSANVGLVANNYSHFRFVKDFRVIAGIGLNVYNCYTAKYLLDYGFSNIIWSIEKTTFDTYGACLVTGHPTLMTLCHCPIREVYGGDCGKCRYNDKLIYSDEKDNRYRFRRIKQQHCYFELISEEEYKRACSCGKIIDLRKI